MMRRWIRDNIEELRLTELHKVTAGWVRSRGEFGMPHEGFLGAHILICIVTLVQAAGFSGIDRVSEELRALLDALGYRDSRHPSGRMAIFLGVYIDRGPKIRDVLDIVRGMVEGGSALAILGIHEINAMRFHTKGGDGEFLRPHTEKISTSTGRR